MASNFCFSRSHRNLWLCVVALIIGVGCWFAYRRQVQALARAQMAANDPRIRRLKQEQQDDARLKFLQSHSADVQRPEPFAWHMSLNKSSGVKFRTHEVKENK